MGAQEGKEYLHICKLYLLSQCVLSYLEHLIPGLHVPYLILPLKSVWGRKTQNLYMRTMAMTYLLQAVNMMCSSQLCSIKL